ncbi:acyl-CoA dehydrogenase [Mycolicibacterium sp.]|uniref:acyl-CoA dehydrogenase n=1 Tax=Mycolicibacterium sp. TaxID=2320850 RepID=UPI001A26EEAE|nr:acyl-CoA dehydrogenase [Mycolicibacterium sp.]MBJ7337199.1 hypothetical protein [Mycolicibacterium sp.]
MTNIVTDSTPTAGEIAMLRESVRDSLQSLYPGQPDEQWQKSWPTHWDALTEQGLWSTIEPVDGSVATAAAVVEELGRVLYPGPSCEVLAATYVLSRLEDGAEVPGAGQGGAPALFATEDTTTNTAQIAAAPSITARLDPMVSGLPETPLIVATNDGGLAFASAARANVRETPSLDVSRHVVELELLDEPQTVESASAARLSVEGRLVKTLLYCADTLGCVDRVLERTAEYATQRTTFGKTIGTYQAVAHRLVDHAVTTQQMRLLLDGATAAFDHGAPDVARQVATVETFFSRRSSEIISDCVQLAGAIGFTWEFGHHFYLRRVVQNTSLAGGRGRPAQRLAQEAQW